MNKVHILRSADYGQLHDDTGFAPSVIDSERADRHLGVVDGAGNVRARCSLWWRDTARFAGESCATIGHYAADNDSDAAILLDAAAGELAARGPGYVVGPMNGCTWRHYRFVTDPGSEPPFLLEPHNPIAWPAQFRRSGFTACANYVSERNVNIGRDKPRLGRSRERFATRGVVVEFADMAYVESLLASLYEVVRLAFADNFMYTPLDFESFARMYRALIAKLDPRLLLVARHDGRVVGFAFALPNGPARTQTVDFPQTDTVIIKTIAVLPDFHYRGLGRLLTVELFERAAQRGYRQAIGALMHVDNGSHKIAGECCRFLRGYQLFVRKLPA